MNNKVIPHYEKPLLEGLRDSDGKSPRQYIKAGLRAVGSGKKLSTKFWVGFLKQFPLKPGASALLPVPPADLDFDNELLDALAVAHVVNPAKRDPSDFVQLMEVQESLNE